MHEAAAILKMQLLMATDIFASFFNQLRLAPEELWKTGVMHPPRSGQNSAQFAIDKVLGFGIRMASNIAQRFANLIRHIGCREMDRMDKEALQLLRCASLEFNKWRCHRLQVERSRLQHQLQVSTNRMAEASDSGDTVAISWAKRARDKATAAVGTEQNRCSDTIYFPLLEPCD